MHSFNLKVLGWFWLTLLISLMSIAIPAWIIHFIGEEPPLPPKKLSVLMAAVERIDHAYERYHGDLELLLSRAKRLKGRMPYEWFIVANGQEIVLSSAALPPEFANSFDGRRFWYFMRSEQPRELNYNWTSLVGPQALPSAPELAVVLWRPERPKPFELLRALPWWAILAVFSVVSTAMSLVLVRSIAQPLNRLGAAFDAVGSGDIKHTIAIDSEHSSDRHLATNGRFVRLFHQFNTMTAKISALMQNQKRQSADISHELRTPLTRLQMTLALLRKKSVETALQPLIQRAEKESELLNLHIERLSELTTMEARAIAQGRKVQSVEALLTALCEDAAFEAQERQLQWQHSLVDACIDVYIEPFHTAIENVVRNAFKYARSTVSLTCSQQGRRQGIDSD